jgi:hypothetical protein
MTVNARAPAASSRGKGPAAGRCKPHALRYFCDAMYASGPSSTALGSIHSTSQ